jgi:hypothetical protein
LTEKFTSIESDEPQTTILERWFPWTHGNVSAKISHNIKPDESKMPQTNNKNSTQPSIPQEKKIEAAQEKKMENVQEKPKKITEKGSSLFKEQIANDQPQDDLFNVPNKPSVLEMWNLIESAGIKREQVDKAFVTEEAVTELYRMVYRRIHYEREQEMIKRLKTYVDKLKEREISAAQTH